MTPRIATWSFVAALAIVGVAAGYVLWRDRGWLSSSDLAFFEIELMRMPGEWPLVGAYSRYGWSHPGPLLYYLLWGPWRLFGGASVGLLFGMLLLHLSALVIAWFAARFRSLAAAVLVVGALLIVWAGDRTSEALTALEPLGRAAVRRHGAGGGVERLHPGPTRAPSCCSRSARCWCRHTCRQHPSCWRCASPACSWRPGPSANAIRSLGGGGWRVSSSPSSCGSHR
ncbi:MAG: hypothetical protein V9E98_00290 [Candidatus Nanopelagicales bacterium]